LWSSTAAATTLLGLLFLDWLLSEYSGAVDRFERRIVFPLFAGAIVCSVVAAYQHFVDMTLLNPTVFAVMGRAAGTMLDGNALGILAALWLPFSITTAIDRAFRRRLQAPVWFAAACVLAVGVWASGSRSALLAATIGSTISIAFLVAIRSRRRDALLAAGTFVGLVAAALALTPLNAGGPLIRIRAMIGPRLQLGSLIETLWTRDGYGAAAVRMIADHPLTGVGIGAFNTYVRDVGLRIGWAYLETDNAQNWWRHQLAELGVLGSVGPFAWTVLFLIAASSIWSRNAARSFIGPTIGAVLGFAAASLVGVPGQVPIVAVTFIVFAFWIVGLDNAEPMVSLPMSRRMSVVIATVVTVFVAGTIVVALTDMRPPYRALRAGWPYHYGFYNQEQSSESQFRWTAKKAVDVVQVRGPWLKLVIGGAVPRGAELDPLEVKVWRDRSLIMRARRHDGTAVTRYVRMPEGASWVMLQIEADRTWRPSDYGEKDTRNLGVAVGRWTWVNAPPSGAVTIE
jgi:hypothetical protein